MPAPLFGGMFMANNWIVDNSFPTFTGQESPKEMIAMLVDYMRQLSDQLRFSMENLDASNWNTQALEAVGTSMTAGVSEQARTLGEQLVRLQAKLNALEATVRSMGQKLEQFLELRETDGEKYERLIQMAEDMNADLQAVKDAQSMLSGMVKADPEGVTIGDTQANVTLVGNVTVNGELI